MKKIVQLGHPALTTKSKEVTDFKDQGIQRLIDEMLEIMLSSKGSSVGLAANQVGELHRIALIRRLDLENKNKDKSEGKHQSKNKKYQWEVLVNPVITQKSESKSTYWEGCLSISNGDLFGQVTRPNKITVEYFDRNGMKKELNAKGFFATLIQHELDHLDGILFTKYVSDPSKLFTREELDEMDD